MLLLLVLVACYLLGSIPWAYIIGRLRGVDIRALGNGNVGAKNTFLQVGRKAGMAVAALDTAKGAAAIFLAQALGFSPVEVYAAGVAVVVGHDFPLFLRFRGGQGFATIVGISLALMPWETVFSLGIMALLLALSRHWSLSNTVGFALLPLIAWWRDQPRSLIIYIALLLPTVGLMKLVNISRQRGLTLGETELPHPR